MSPAALVHVNPAYVDLLRCIGLDGESVFTHPDIRVWRSLPDRENGTLDVATPEGRSVRLHVKRYPPIGQSLTPGEIEARGLALLSDRGIPTAPLVAWGRLADGRSFAILEDLAGYRPGDKLLEEDGYPFARLLEATADLAARLHSAGLHHRDLYLCHFFAKDTGGGVDLKLIDAARVRPVPRLFRMRWIVKDLAQFWYSTLRHDITDGQRHAWLERYARQRGLAGIDALRRRIERKVRWMARHDASLHRKQPLRNVAIPADQPRSQAAAGRAMKIALVIRHANTALGGAEIYTINLARSLVARGHEVSLLAESFGDDLPPAHKVPLAAKGWTRLGRYTGFLDSLDAHLASTTYDVVHAMLPVRWCDVYHPHAGLAAQALEESYLRHNRPLRRMLSKWSTRANPIRRQYARVEREMMSSERRPTMLCLTNEMVRTAWRYFPGASERIVELYLGLDLARFDPAARPTAGAELRQSLGIAADCVVALNVAQDFERKGVREAIATIAMLGDAKVTLLVVGRGDAGPYRREAQRLGASDRVIFAGPMRDVYSAYQASDFLLFPGRVEPCGLVVLESMVMGRPVIVTRQVVAHGMVTPGRHGFVVDEARDIPALAEAARKLLDNGVRRQMSEACLELRPALSQDRHMENLLAIYAKRSR